MRPRSSNWMLIGLRTSGSAAPSWTSKPGGTWNPRRSSSGVRGELGAILAAYGSCATPTPVSHAQTSSAKENDKRIILDSFTIKAGDDRLGGGALQARLTAFYPGLRCL